MRPDYHDFPILYVDDERANLLALRYALEDEFTFLTVSNGEEALRTLLEQDVAILLADQRMPGLTGVEVCARARELKPNVVRMIVTAYADLSAAEHAINHGQVSRYIPKPWQEAELRETLRKGIEVFHLNRLVADMEAKLLREERAGAAVAVNRRLVHEVGNTLTVMGLALTAFENVARKVNEPAIRDQLLKVTCDARSSVQHATGLIGRLRSGGDVRLDEPPVADAERVIDIALAILRLELSRKLRCDVVIEGRSTLAIRPTELAQVLINLLTNACEAMPDGEAARRRVEIRLQAAGDEAILVVSDNGPGIPAELLPVLFEQGASTKGEGRGLGLSIVQQIVERQGGTIGVESEVGRGTRVRVVLPLVPA